MSKLLRGVTPLTVLSLLALLCAILTVTHAQCTLYPAGQPIDDDLPTCGCGEAFYGDCPDGNSSCVTCPSGWNSSGCFPTSDPSYSDATVNPKCQCSANPSGACCEANGVFSNASTLCRSSSGCGLDTYCSGNSTECPDASPLANGTWCGASSGPCQEDSFCDGVSTSCPSGFFSPPATICANATGPCQHNATCTGSSATCPALTYVSHGEVCESASGGLVCQADAVCSGDAPECPPLSPMAAGTVCYNASGPCETNATCDGSSLTCPTPSLLTRGTICDISNVPCYGDGECSGFDEACGPRPRKASGALCGYNPICTTAYANSTCNSLGVCNLGQCSSCPNGLQGGDCTCDSNPPNGGGPYRCYSGMWNTTISATSPTVYIFPNSDIYIAGNLSTSSLIFEGINSTILVGRCANVSQLLVLLSPPDLALIDSTKGGISVTFIEVLSDDSCASLLDVPLTVTGGYSASACERLVIRKDSRTDAEMTVQFSVDASKCESSSSNKWIIVGTVVAVVVILAVVIVVAIFAVNEKARRCIWPNSKNKDEELNPHVS